LKVVTVSYINSYPFVYGLDFYKKDFNFDIILCPPSSCAQMAINNEVDFALIPLAALPMVKHNYNLMPQYCIGAVRSVSTVLLISNNEISSLKKIFLDTHSLTSVKLVKLLASQYWHILPEFVSHDINSNMTLNDGEAFLAIGDKCFELKGKYNFTFDLFDEWNKFTRLPFVFAVWMASKNVSVAEIEKINTALSLGNLNKEASLRKYLSKSKNENFDFYLNYLANNINYIYDKNKEKALNLFLDLIKFVD